MGTIEALVELQILREKVAALERAFYGWCFECVHAIREMQIYMNGEKATGMVYCNYHPCKHGGRVKTCEYWEFDYARFIAEAEGE